MAAICQKWAGLPNSPTADGAGGANNFVSSRLFARRDRRHVHRGWASEDRTEEAGEPGRQAGPNDPEVGFDARWATARCRLPRVKSHGMPVVPPPDAGRGGITGRRRQRCGGASKTQKCSLAEPGGVQCEVSLGAASEVTCGGDSPEARSNSDRGLSAEQTLSGKPSFVRSSRPHSLSASSWSPSDWHRRSNARRKPSRRRTKSSPHLRIRRRRSRSSWTGLTPSRP